MAVVDRKWRSLQFHSLHSLHYTARVVPGVYRSSRRCFFTPFLVIVLFFAAVIVDTSSVKKKLWIFWRTSFFTPRLPRGLEGANDTPTPSFFSHALILYLFTIRWLTRSRILNDFPFFLFFTFRTTSSSRALWHIISFRVLLSTLHFPNNFVTFYVGVFWFDRFPFLLFCFSRNKRTLSLFRFFSVWFRRSFI